MNFFIIQYVIFLLYYYTDFFFFFCVWNTNQTSFVFVLSQVHAYIISSLKKEMPTVFGKDNKKKELINSLGEIYSRIEREHQISPGDFPNLKKMQVRLI